MALTSTHMPETQGFSVLRTLDIADPRCFTVCKAGNSFCSCPQECAQHRCKKLRYFK